NVLLHSFRMYERCPMSRQVRKRRVWIVSEPKEHEFNSIKTEALWILTGLFQSHDQMRPLSMSLTHCARVGKFFRATTGNVFVKIYTANNSSTWHGSPTNNRLAMATAAFPCYDDDSDTRCVGECRHACTPEDGTWKMAPKHHRLLEDAMAKYEGLV